jgi:hypothetical protein
MWSAACTAEDIYGGFENEGDGERPIGTYRRRQIARWRAVARVENEPLGGSLQSIAREGDC